MGRIVVVDDDRDWLTLVRALLESGGHKVRVYTDAAAVVAGAREFGADLLITDILMPGVSGSAVHAIARRELGGDLPILVCSSTRMKIKSEDPRLAHLTKQEAPDHLLATVQLMLDSPNGAPSTGLQSTGTEDARQ